MLVALNLLLALGGVALIHGYLNKRDRAARAAGPLTAVSTATSASVAIDPAQGEATKLAAAEREEVDSAAPGTVTTVGTAATTTPKPASPEAGSAVSGAAANEKGISTAAASGPAPARARIDAGVALPKTKASPDAGVIRPKPALDPKPTAEPATQEGSSGQPGGESFATPPPSEEEEGQQLERMYAKISLVVSRHQGQLARCYESAAKASNPSDPLEGKIRVQFAIHPDGVARSIGVVSNNTGSTVLSNCIVGLVGSWTFPSSGGDALEFVWPFDFQAVK